MTPDSDTVSDERLADFYAATNYVDISVAEVQSMARELQRRRATPPADRAAVVEALEAAREIVRIDDAWKAERLSGSAYSNALSHYLNDKFVIALARAALSHKNKDNG